MSNLIILSFLSIIVVTPLGSYFVNNNDRSILNYSKHLIYGFILLSFFALLLNFIFPLNKFINTILLLVPISIIIKKKSFFFNYNFLKFIILNSIIICLLIAKSEVYRPDAYLYHLPFIDILNHNKIIVGLSNLHFRFGHVSIIQYTSSILNNFIFLTNGIFFSIAIIASSIIINFLAHLFNSIKQNKYNLHFFFIFFVIIFISYKMNRYSEYGNDAPTHFLFFFLVSEILYTLNNKNNYFPKLVLISAFILMNKITMIFAIILPFLIVKKYSKFIFFNRTNYFTALFLFLWFLKNIITSGCIIYPVKNLCFSHLIWSDVELVEKVSIENEAWTKGWIDQTGINKYNQKDYSKNFNWIDTWSGGHLKKINSIMYPYLIFSLIIISTIFIKSKKKLNKDHSLTHIYLLVLLTIFSVIWILKVPVYRFGYSYSVSLICLFFSVLCSTRQNLQNIKIFKFIILFTITVFISKNLIRIVDFQDEYSKKIWPKIKLFENDSEKIRLINIDNFEYFESKTECGYGYAPCTNYKNLKLKSSSHFSYTRLINSNKK